MKGDNKLDFTDAIQSGINDFVRLGMGKKYYDQSEEVFEKPKKITKSKFHFRTLIKFFSFLKLSVVLVLHIFF